MAVHLHQRRRGRPIAEMNITPMVDVLLVLLVIFMVAAPLMPTGVTVDLPGPAAAPLAQQKDPLVITLTDQGEIFLQKTPITLSTLPDRLRAITGENAQAQIFVRADQKLPYGKVMSIMGLIKKAGYHKVALLTDPSSK